jgi:transposase InsO family protein
MDFIDGLTQSGNVNCILVVVDKFTIFAHFIPMRHPYTVESVAKLFLDNVYKLHGLPASIVSDHDKIFTSHFWRELFRLAQVQLSMSSAYHPQSDGHTEHVNRCLETFLRCFVSACPKKWVSCLVLAEYWYNTCFHSAIGHSPFEAMYG